MERQLDPWAFMASRRNQHLEYGQIREQGNQTRMRQLGHGHPPLDPSL
jgi:hypothetical protein